MKAREIEKARVEDGLPVVSLVAFAYLNPTCIERKPIVQADLTSYKEILLSLCRCRCRFR